MKSTKRSLNNDSYCEETTMSMNELQKQTTANIQAKANLIWEIATHLVGLFKPHEYGKVILPMTVLKRFDDALMPTKAAVVEMAKKLDVPASTLRYYDKEGLLPFVERSSGGIRMFQESDFEWLQVIGCMKKAGMSIRDIRQYIELALRGDDTIDTRLKMFTHQRDVLLAQMEEMRHTLETVEYKCWYYETAKAAGTIDVPRDMADEDVPERFRAIRRELKTIPQE